MDRGRKAAEPRFPPWVRSANPPGQSPSGGGELDGWGRRAASPRRSSHSRRRRSPGNPDHKERSRRRRRRSVREERIEDPPDATGEGPEESPMRSPTETVPVLELGGTSGVTSAGAWAARLEIANLLEARCDPDQSGKNGKRRCGIRLSS